MRLLWLRGVEFWRSTTVGQVGEGVDHTEKVGNHCSGTIPKHLFCYQRSTVQHFRHSPTLCLRNFSGLDGTLSRRSCSAPLISSTPFQHVFQKMLIEFQKGKLYFRKRKLYFRKCKLYFRKRKLYFRKCFFVCLPRYSLSPVVHE